MKKIALLSLLFLTLFACRKDVDQTISEEEIINGPVTSIVDYDPIITPVNASLFGTVKDEAGVPVEGAAVKLGNETTITDDFGRFIYKDITMNAAGTFVVVEKLGYFDGSYRFFPSEGSVNYSNITLLTRTPGGSFTSTDGGTITTSDGAKIEFPANSVVNANGTSYEGTVEVAVRWIDPTDSDLQAIMPGGLQGVDENAEEVALGSFGMMAVELESSTGAPLNLGNDLQATLTFPIPAELVGNAPDEIPLWSFNEEYGLWVQEGSATKQGDNYVGNVSHFSFWNCDYPFPLIELTGQILSSNGVPIVNAWVHLQIVSNGSSASGGTNGDGVFSGKVPKDETFIMTISHYQSCEAFTMEIGPFSEDTDMGVITLDLNEAAEVSGTVVDCDGNLVENGWVSINVGSYYNYDVFIEDGTFNFSFLTCGDEETIEVIAYDLDDLTLTDPPLTFTFSETIDLGTIAACGDVIDEYFEIIVDGETYTMYEVSGVFGGPDSTWINANNFANQNETSATIGFNGLDAVGTYDGSIVSYAYMNLTSNGGANALWMECGNQPGGPNTCGFTEFDITEFGQVGEKVIGTFSGNLLFGDNTGAMVEYPVTGSFKVDRE